MSESLRASPCAPLFSLRTISHVFPNGNAALSNITLDIQEGECLFITGSNGSGKTLLMRIACGLFEPSSGEVFFRGTPLDKARDLRSSVGMVFQDADSQIVGETVAEDVAFGPKNLRLPKGEVEERVRAALSAMGLTGKRDYPPRRLSGGEKRRLAVAGILAMGCSAIIMDEPFANLDCQGVVQTLESIKRMKSEGKTLVILTHELEKALAYADRLVVLDKGEIRDQGRPDETLGRLVPSYGVRDPRKSYTCAADCTWLD
ncbi:MAG: energy-coupling factor ABC transporter ATP-binding protein [Treponema sp.]|jgi:biotin transport system ATP-binding protein|nr:energy-coupling factor ABC transporter ATP-binding protein [Treponema sp.]